MGAQIQTGREKTENSLDSITERVIDYVSQLNTERSELTNLPHRFFYDGQWYFRGFRNDVRFLSDFKDLGVTSRAGTYAELLAEKIVPRKFFESMRGKGMSKAVFFVLTNRKLNHLISQ